MTGPEDYLYVPLFQSLTVIATGLISLIVAFRAFPIRFYIPPVAALIREFKNGWHIFVSPHGHHALHDEQYRHPGSVRGQCRPSPTTPPATRSRGRSRACNSRCPRRSSRTSPSWPSQSRQAALAFTSRVIRLVSILTLALSVGLFVAAPFIARVALGEKFAPGVPVIRILSFLPFIIGLSNIFGVQIMVNFGLKRAMTRILTTAGFLNIIMALALVVPLQHIGISVTALLTETFVTTVMFIVLRRHGIHVFRPRAEEERREV